MTDLTEEVLPENCKDNSEISEYKSCPRKHFIRYVLGWRREGASPALSFGGAWHAGQDAVWGAPAAWGPSERRDAAMERFLDHWESEGFQRELSLADADALAPRTPGVANEMYHNYINARWRMLQEADVVAIERPFAVPMPDMEGVWYIGKMDKTVQYAGQKLVLEHKTTTAYAVNGNFQPYYTESWHSSPQVKGYQFAGNLYYGSIDAVWVDAALVHKKIHDAFKFIPVAHSFPLIQEWLWDTKAWIARMKADEISYKVTGKLLHGVFIKNEESCYGKYGTCPFLDICRTCIDPSQLDGPPPGYIEERWSPFDKVKLIELIDQHK